MKKRYHFSLKNWIRAGIFTAFAASFSINLQAQTAPIQLWDKTLGGSTSDGIGSLMQTTDGGFIFGGNSNSGISGDKSQSCQGLSDFWVVKTDASGNKVWDKTFGGSDNDNLYSLQQTVDGGYILGGSSISGLSGDKTQANNGSEDYWVIKLDSSGNKIWDKTIGGNGYDRFMSLQQTSDGGYMLGGTSNSGISGDKTQITNGAADFWIVKLDSNGNKTWDKNFGSSGNEYLYTLQQTLDGGYILCGYSDSGIGGDKSRANNGGDDFWIIKLDANGNKVWDKTYGGMGYEYYPRIKQTSDGGYILGGRSDSGIGGDKSQASKGNYDYWVLKLNTIGNKIWDKTFGGSDADFFEALQQTSDGGYILGGSSSSSMSGDKSQNSIGAFDYWVVKLDGSGNKLWDRTLGGFGQEMLSALQQTSDGGFIIGGSSLSGYGGNKSQASKGDSDFWVLKLAGNATGIEEIEPGFAVSIFPNPSPGEFNLQLTNLKAPLVEVTIFDLLGRVVLEKKIQITNNQLSEELTLSNAKGIFLVKLKTEKQTAVKKVIVK